jgi:16S rRNA (adenine1518-N6/adenine1519-N6)-dimethyltransferase
VWSAMVRLIPRKEPRFAVDARFAAVVAAAFSHRRKTVRNALRGYVEEPAMRAAGVDPSARPEELTPEQFGALANSAGGL